MIKNTNIRVLALRYKALNHAFTTSLTSFICHSSIYLYHDKSFIITFVQGHFSDAQSINIFSISAQTESPPCLNTTCLY